MALSDMLSFSFFWRSSRNAERTVLVGNMKFLQIVWECGLIRGTRPLSFPRHWPSLMTAERYGTP